MSYKNEVSVSLFREENRAGMRVNDNMNRCVLCVVFDLHVAFSIQ